VDEDQEATDAGTGDKILAAAGLAVGVILILMSVDLLRPKRKETDDDDSP
jgi:hypothetical protein